jgi:hypothetical protein
MQNTGGDDKYLKKCSRKSANGKDYLGYQGVDERII